MRKFLLLLLFTSLFSIEGWNDLGSSVPVPYDKIVTSYQDGNTTINFSMQGFFQFPAIINEETEYVIKTINGASLLNTGSPDLQKFSASIIIPDNAEMNVRIDNVDYVEFENINIAPSKGNFSRLIDPPNSSLQ